LSENTLKTRYICPVRSSCTAVYEVFLQEQENLKLFSCL
jgi:hypothetical protein